MTGGQEESKRWLGPQCRKRREGTENEEQKKSGKGERAPHERLNCSGPSLDDCVSGVCNCPGLLGCAACARGLSLPVDLQRASFSFLSPLRCGPLLLAVARLSHYRMWMHCSRCMHEWLWLSSALPRFPTSPYFFSLPLGNAIASQAVASPPTREGKPRSK